MVEMEKASYLNLTDKQKKEVDQLIEKACSEPRSYEKLTTGVQKAIDLVYEYNGVVV